MSVFQVKSGPGHAEGFTLLEVMVALTIGVIILGGVMGAISASLQYTYRVKERSLVQPFLDAAAQEILIQPERILEGQMVLKAFRDAPPVFIAAVKVPHMDDFGEARTGGELYRVMLTCRGQRLEMSVLVPRSALD
ncbi:MAG: prepilin-type N-terminal cleavage/methylation domain-containing protein [Syntrophobacteraceae bacterium]|jgi:prepilin-type N-terminal cleavage/methylation domain-containing protein|nr:prepilin-type N-terminal cleavage/methylation domain-containing protein [Syntrophobacteraceae bacterium]